MIVHLTRRIVESGISWLYCQVMPYCKLRHQILDPGSGAMNSNGCWVTPTAVSLLTCPQVGVSRLSILKRQPLLRHASCRADPLDGQFDFLQERFAHAGGHGRVVHGPVPQPDADHGEDCRRRITRVAA